MSQGWQRVGALTELPGVVRGFGVDPDAVCSAAGIDPALLLDREARIPFPAACLLIKIAADETGCDHIGLLVGQRNDTQSLGLVGALMRNAPNWGRAMLDLCENQHRYVRGGVPYLMIRGGYAYSGYAIYHREAPYAEYFQEGAIAVGVNLMREVAGVGPEEVLLMRRPPADPQLYRSHYGCPVTFNASQSALVYPKDLLERPTLAADREARRALEAKVRDYWAIDLPRLADQVVRLLRPRVVTGAARLEAVSEALGLHPRLLERTLQAEGTSFRDLLRETQVDVAKRLLESTDLSITEIGDALGYGDTSAFSNAFRRAAGQSPRAWRTSGARSEPAVGAKP